MAFVPKTQADLEELWRRIFPDSYTQPIEDEAGGQGFDTPALQAAIMERVQDAIATSFQAYYLKPHSTQTRPPASGGVRASGTLEIRRTAPAAGEVTLIKGLLFLATKPGTRGETIELGFYRLLADTVFPSGSLGPVTVDVEAVVEGFAGNMPAGSISQFASLGREEILATVSSTTTLDDLRSGPPVVQGDLFTLDQIGQYVAIQGLASGPVTARRIVGVTQGNPTSVAQIDPGLAVGDVGDEPLVLVLEFADLGFTVTQPADITGGVSAELDAIARDRNQGRVEGESDGPFRDRLCGLPDNISPAAILRIAGLILSPFGIGFALNETRDVATLKGFVWDLDAYDFGSVQAIPKVVGSELVGDGAVWMSESTATRFFILCVGVGNQGEFGGGYDTPMFPNSNAWDNMFWDGQPVIYNSLIGQLHEAADQARASGVGFVIIRDPNL